MKSDSQQPSGASLPASDGSAVLDTKELKRLCEAVIRDIGNDGDVPMAQDWGWANLVRESLPALKAFLHPHNATH